MSTALRAALITCTLALSGPTFADTQDPPDASAPRKAPEQVEEITVTGSRLQGSSELGASPIEVLDRSDLEALPGLSLSEATAWLPQNTGGEHRADIFSGVNAGTTALNLRGMGMGNTLVLFDGRRSLISGAIAQGGSSFVDVGQLPRIMIERVEVLKDGATALHGSDAVAGVVNYIPRRGFGGLELDVGFRWTPEANAAWRASYEALWGWGNERTRVHVGGAFFQNNKFPTTRRPFTAPNFDFGSAGGGISNFGSPGAFRVDFLRDPATGQPVLDGEGRGTRHDIPDHVERVDALGRTLNYSDLQDLLARFDLEARLPLLDPNCQLSGVDGREGTRLEFIPGTGFCGFSYVDNFDLQYRTKRYRVFAMLSHELSEELEFFSDFLYSRSEIDELGVSPSFPILGIPSVPEHNPGNFFTVPVRYSGRAHGEAFPGHEADVDNTTTRTLIGLRGAFPSSLAPLAERDWGWEISAVHSRSTRAVGASDIVWPRFVLALNGLGGSDCPVNSGGGLEGGIREIIDPVAAEVLDLSDVNAGLNDLVARDRVLAAGPGQSGCEYFNPFSSALLEPDRANSESLSEWLLGGGGEHNRRTVTTTTLKLVDFIMRGDLLELSAGAAELALGYHFRQDEYDVKRNAGQEIVSMYVFVAGGSSFTQQQDTQSLFGELRIPVTDRFETQLALRWEDYGGTIGHSLDPRLALRWQIGDRLAFRASAGRSFRAPSLSEQHSVRTDLQHLDDGLRPAAEEPPIDTRTFPSGDFRAVDTVGNIHLDAEHALTANAGLILEPLDGWRVTLDYWRIDFEDLVRPQPAQQVLNHETSITGPIFAAEGCSTRLLETARSLGVQREPLSCDLQRVQSLYVNSGGVFTDGVDLSTRYDLGLGGLGDLRLMFSGSHIIQYYIRGNEAVGCGIDSQGNNRRKCDASGKLNQNSIARTLPRFKFNVMASWRREGHRAHLTWHHISPYESDYSASGLNGTKVSAWNTFDFVYAWPLRENATLTFGASNIFDQDPPAVHGRDLQYDSRTHDPFGRMLYARIKYTLD